MHAAYMLAVFKVSTAATFLKEEKARAADREALLKETLLRERDKEERCGTISTTARQR